MEGDSSYNRSPLEVGNGIELEEGAPNNEPADLDPEDNFTYEDVSQSFLSVAEESFGPQHHEEGSLVAAESLNFLGTGIHPLPFCVSRS